MPIFEPKPETRDSLCIRASQAVVEFKTLLAELSKRKVDSEVEKLIEEHRLDLFKYGPTAKDLRTTMEGWDTQTITRYFVSVKAKYYGFRSVLSRKGMLP